MIRISFKKAQAELLSAESFTSGMVKAVEVQFTFSEEWQGLTRVAVFSAGGIAANCVLAEDNTCCIPWECLQTPGVRLLMGVYGTRDGTLVLPSERCDLGLILGGTALGEDASAEGSPSLAEQMIIKANEALATAASVRADADAGAFRGEKGATGDGATVAIGAVVTTAPGSEAAITNSGTATAAILNFSLPTGPQGAKGDPGEAGPQGVQGLPGAKGDPGDAEVRLFTLSLPLVSWGGTASPYTQAVTVSGGTANSKIDLQPDAAQLAALIEAGVQALFISNNGGVFTATALGEKPTADLAVQATRTEVTSA